MARSAGLKVGRFAGAPVVLAPTVLLAAAFYFASAWLLLSQFHASSRLVITLALTALIVVSVAAHEIGHILAAVSSKLKVRRIVLDMWGGTTTFDSVPTTPARIAAIAGVGPVVNLVLAGLFELARKPFELSAGADRVLAMGVVVNLCVAAFNALPGLPMDGGQVLEAAVWRATGDRSLGTRIGYRVSLAMGVASFGYAVWRFATGRQFDLGVLAALVLGTYFVYLGVGAQRSANRMRAIETLGDQLLRPAVRFPLHALVPDATAALASGAEVVLYDRDLPVAIVDRTRLGLAPAGVLQHTSLATVSRKVGPDAIIPPGLTGPDLLSAVRGVAASSTVAVVADHELRGVMYVVDVIRTLSDSAPTRTSPAG